MPLTPVSNPEPMPVRSQVVDTEWVLAKLDEFQTLFERHTADQTSDGRDALEDEIKAALPVMQRIADAVEPGVLTPWHVSSRFGMSFAPGRNRVIRLRGIVTSKAEVDEKLGPAGPQLAASGLHRGIWGAAAELWDDGHLRHAVQNAATFVDLRLQAKLERQDTSGADLAMQAFRIEKLKSGERVLRFPGLVEGSEQFKSRHEGAKFFGAGVMLAIRNPATHDLTQPSPQVALEYLAALSILARWIDEAEIYVVP